jgi:hypothetical protein
VYSITGTSLERGSKRDRTGTAGGDPACRLLGKQREDAVFNADPNAVLRARSMRRPGSGAVPSCA